MPPYQPRPFLIATTDADDVAIFSSTTALEAGAHEPRVVRDRCGGGLCTLPVHSFWRTGTAGRPRTTLDASLTIDWPAKLIPDIRGPEMPAARRRSLCVSEPGIKLGPKGHGFMGGLEQRANPRARIALESAYSVRIMRIDDICSAPAKSAMCPMATPTS